MLTIFLVNGYIQTKKLFDAIENRDYEGVKTSIRSGAWINQREHLLYIPNIIPTNPTPLIVACKNGDTEVVELLLQNGADINREDNYTGQTPLLAALHGKKSNRFSLAMYLIDRGANIHVNQSSTSPFQRSLLILGSDTPETIQDGFNLFKYLLQNNVDMTIRIGEENALTFAAHYGNYNAVKYLLDEGYFDVNVQDNAGDTALISATTNNHAEIVIMLLEYNADISLTDSNGKTASDIAKEKNYEQIFDLLNQ